MAISMATPNALNSTSFMLRQKTNKEENLIVNPMLIYAFIYTTSLKYITNKEMYMQPKSMDMG